MNGKGSKPRPFSVKYEKYAENWDSVFSKKTAKESLTNDSQKPKLPTNLKK
jgi:hypothetical protein